TPADQDATNNTATTLVEQGKQIFLSEGCLNCHSISGISTPNIGPDLTRISQRMLLGAGVLTNSKENLGKWLKDPQTYKPGCKMPDFNLTDQQVDQLVAFLESLN
ncbi:MAG: cytochrome c, partial [Mariniblastus sp.]|nr:cytochrome c [Mariniblastus sp.]